MPCQRAAAGRNDLVDDALRIWLNELFVRYAEIYAMVRWWSRIWVGVVNAVSAMVAGGEAVLPAPRDGPLRNFIPKLGRAAGVCSGDSGFQEINKTDFPRTHLEIRLAGRLA